MTVTLATLIIITIAMATTAAAAERPTLSNLYATEHATIIEAAEANNCTDPTQLCILFAIRTAENGRPGIEFGVLHPRAVDKPNSLRVQAGWCAATVSKNHKRWLASKQDVDFITFLGNRYCPVGADNDPTGLNKHWVRNVRKITERNLRVHSGHDPDTNYHWATAKEIASGR
jgi:hypothetical protein